MAPNTPALLVVLAALTTSACSTAPATPRLPAIPAGVQRTFTIGGSTIRVTLVDGLAQDPATVMTWVHHAAEAVTVFYHHYPVPDVDIVVAPRHGNPVNSGTEYYGRRIVIHLDPKATAPDLRDDWELTHEMFHLGLAMLNGDYHYLEEGLSDYLEPLARARVGYLTPEEAWRGFVEGMPQGLPDHPDSAPPAWDEGQPESNAHGGNTHDNSAAGGSGASGGGASGGLDGTRDWGRIYWGGCIFWLMVDLDIRERSGGRCSLDDSIRAIVDAGGNGRASWSLERVIRVGDAATGTGSIQRIHDLLGPRPVDPHLDDIWRKLGIREKNGTVTFDDHAPLAAIRRQMMAPVPPAVRATYLRD